MNNHSAFSHFDSASPMAILPMEDYWLVVDALKGANQSQFAEVCAAIGVYRNSIHCAGRLASMISTIGARAIGELGVSDQEALDYYIAAAANYDSILRSFANQRIAA